MGEYYILDADRNIVPAELMEWALWFNDINARTVAKDVTPKGTSISTVFLGLDHKWTAYGPPVLFETMIFGGPEDQYQERYCTWDEAERGHLLAVKLALKHEEE